MLTLLWLYFEQYSTLILILQLVSFVTEYQLRKANLNLLDSRWSPARCYLAVFFNLRLSSLFVFFLFHLEKIHFLLEWHHRHRNTLLENLVLRLLLQVLLHLMNKLLEFIVFRILWIQLITHLDLNRSNLVAKDCCFLVSISLLFDLFNLLWGHR